MHLDQYQQLAGRTAMNQYTEREWKQYLALGLDGEAGEVSEYIKKRHFHGDPERPEEVAKELGDVLWYLAGLATAYGYTLSTIAEMNVAKLAKRHPDGFTSGYDSRAA